MEVSFLIIKPPHPHTHHTGPPTHSLISGKHFRGQTRPASAHHSLGHNERGTNHTLSLNTHKVTTLNTVFLENWFEVVEFLASREELFGENVEGLTNASVLTLYSPGDL